MQSIRKILLCTSLLCAASLPAVARDCHVFAEVGVSPSRNVGSPWGFFAGTGERDAGVGIGAGCTFAHGIGFEMARVQLSEMGVHYGTDDFPPVGDALDRIESMAIYASYRFTDAESRWHAAARIGMHRWSFDTAFPNGFGGQPYAYSYDDSDIAYGFDLGHALTKRWLVGIGWSEYGMNETSEDRVALRVEYHFR